MTRLVFSGLAAAMLVSVLALWWRPHAPGSPAPGEAVADPPAAIAPAPASAPDPTPEATEAAAAPAQVGPAAPPTAAASPPAPEPAAGPAAAPEVATPRLEQGPVEVVTTPEAFSEAPAESRTGASPDEAGPSEDLAGEPPAPRTRPVDIERSGDLIRRMLVLYDAMRD